MALLDDLKKGWSNFVSSSGIADAASAIKEYFSPDIAVSNRPTATANSVTDYTQQRQTPGRVTQASDQYDSNQMVQDIVDQYSQPAPTQVDYSQNQEELVLPERLPETGATPLAAIPAAAVVKPLEDLAQDIQVDPIEPVPVITEQAPQLPPVEEETFWDQALNTVQEIGDALGSLYTIPKTKSDLLETNGIKNIEESVTGQTDLIISDNEIREINSQLQSIPNAGYSPTSPMTATLGNKKQKILEEFGIQATPEQWEKFSTQYSDYLTAQGEEAVIHKSSYDEKRFGKVVASGIQQDVANVTKYNDGFTVWAQNKVKAALDSGDQKFGASLGDASYRTQRLADQYGQNVNYFAEQVYNMATVRAQLIKDSPESANDINFRYATATKAIDSMVKGYDSVFKDYTEQILQGKDNLEAWSAVEERVKEAGYANINAFISKDLPTEGIPESMQATIKLMSPKDAIATVQNAFNINANVDRIANGESYALPIVRIVANSLQAIGSGITGAFGYADSEVLGSEAASADISRITNIDLTKEGVGLTRQVLNEIGAVRKELLGFMIPYKLLSSIPMASTAVATGKSTFVNSSFWAFAKNTTRLVGIDYGLSQYFNAQSTSKDTPIDMLGDLAGGIFEVVGGINAYAGLANRLTGLGPKGIYSFSKLVDNYGVDLGNEAIRHSIGDVAIVEAKAKGTDLSKTDALALVDNPNSKYGKIYANKTKISPEELKVYRQNMAEIENAITRVSEKDPQGVNQLMKEKYAQSVERKIKLIGETYKMTGETEAQRRYLQLIQNELADPTKNIADMIKLDQRVPGTVQFGPWYSSLRSETDQTIFNETQEIGSFRTPLEVEQQIAKGLGVVFTPSGVYSADELVKIANGVDDEFSGIKEVFQNKERYFDETTDGFKLNRDGLEKLRIEDRRDAVQTIINDPSTSDEFYTAVDNAKNTGVALGVDYETLDNARRLGTHEKVSQVLSTVLC